MKRLLVIAILTLPSLAVFAQAEYINHDGSTTGYVLKVRQDLNNGDYLHPVRVLDVTDYDVTPLLRVYDSYTGTVEGWGYFQSLSGFRIGLDNYNDGSCSNCVTWTAGSGAPAGGCSVGSLYSRKDAPDDSHLFYVCGPNGWVAK